MISIIVPIYNTETYLQRCLENLLCQTEQDLQIILVDDGSTDGSYAIAHSFAVRDTRILLLQQPHAGQSAARNLALQHAQGEFLAFVDADDALEPEWCEKHLQAIADGDYVQSGYKRTSNSVATKPQIPGYRYQFTSPCMRLYKRKKMAGLSFPEGMIYEDVIWSVDWWLRSPKCRMLNYSGYLYTLNPHSTTSQTHKEAQKRLFEELRKRLKGQTIKGKLIILITLLRLKIHFIS